MVQLRLRGSEVYTMDISRSPIPKVTLARSVGGAAVAASLPLMLVIDRLDSIALGGLALAGLAVGLVGGFRRRLDRSTVVAGVALTMLLIAPLLSYAVGHQDDLGFHVLGRYLRFMLFIPVVVAVQAIPVTEDQLRWGSTLGMVSLTAYLMIELVFGHTGRIEGATGAPIVFGDLSVCSAMVSSALWLRRQGGLKVVLPMAGAIFTLGAVAAAMSGTRSAFFSLVSVGILWALWGARRAGVRYAVGSAAVIAALIAGVIWVLPGTPLITRARNLSQARKILAYAWAPPPTELIHARCPNDRRLLTALLPNIGHPRWVTLRVERVPTKASQRIEAFGCKWGYWVEAINVSTERNGWIWWHPELPPRSERRPTSTTTVIEGCGTAHIATWSPPRRYCYRNPGELRFSGVLPDPPTTVFTFPAGSVLNFIPLQEQPGGIYYLGFGLGSAYSRLEMWKSAWAAFINRPWIGGGPGWYRAFARRQIVADRASPTIWDYEHPHNEYLFVASSSGAFGILCFIAAAVAVWHFPDRKRDSIGAFALRSTMVLIGLLCTAETLFIHSIAISWVVIMIALTRSVASSRESGTRGRDGPKPG